MSLDDGPGPGHRHPGDGWVECRCGHRHWGLCGAAGLLAVRFGGDGAPESVILQHRSPWSHQGSTWSIPGGAAMPGETALETALREAAEEAGIDSGAVRPFARHTLDHGGWHYTTVIAAAVGDWAPRPTDDESLAVAWVPVTSVPAMDLHAAFAQAWPALLALATAERDATWTEP